MATRTFCDHCGNTVQNPTVLSFGPLRSEILKLRSREDALRQSAYDMQKAQAFGGGGGASGVGVGVGISIVGSGGVAQAPPPDKHPQIKITDVDLCPTCVPIWFERVSRLCKASDPKEE